MNLSILDDLLEPGGRKFSSCRLEFERISFNTESSFSVFIVSKILRRTSAASPVSTSCPLSSPPSYISFPISENEMTFSNMTFANIRPRNSAALGASCMVSSKLARTASNLFRTVRIWTEPSQKMILIYKSTLLIINQTWRTLRWADLDLSCCYEIW